MQNGLKLCQNSEFAILTTGLIGSKPMQGEEKRQRKRQRVLKARTKNIPRFNLRDTKGDEAKIVYLRYRYEKGVYPIVLATGVKVSPQYWNAKDGRARRVAALPEATEINNFLSNLEQKTVKSALKLLSEDGRIDRDKLTKEIKEHLGQKTTTLFSAWAAERSAKSGNQDEKRLITLWPQFDKKGLSLDQITVSTVSRFKEFMLDREAKPSYIAAVLRGFKRVMKQAYELDKTKNTVHLKESYFKHKSVKHREIALSFEQIKLVYKAEMLRRTDGSLLPYYVAKKVVVNRDAFIIDCLTGLRSSDLKRIDPEIHVIELNGVELLKITPIKTSASSNEPVFIPIHPIVREIFERYEWNLPEMSKSFTYSKHLKIIAYNAGLNKLEERIIHSGRNKRIEVNEFWELVKPHTARRTLGSILRDQGFDVSEVKAVGGWLSDSAFARYDVRERQQIALKMTEHPFWSGELKKA